MSDTKAAAYALLQQQTDALLTGETDLIANMANFSALLYHQLPDLNWVGFYLLRGDELVLGPFQGQVACVRIPVGKGVCGTAVATGEIQRVADVHAFPGHIACDAASASEIVLPLRRQSEILAVLDIDSPLPSRFDEADQEGLAALVACFEQHLLKADQGVND